MTCNVLITCSSQIWRGEQKPSTLLLILVCLKLLGLFRSDFICICATEGQGKTYILNIGVESVGQSSCDIVAGEVSLWLRNALTVLAEDPEHS